MTHARHKSEKCPNCKLYKAICVCSEVKIFDLKTRVTLLIHTKEVNKATNTGKLAQLMLSNCRTLIVGTLDGELREQDIVSEGYENLILFHSASNVLDSEFLSTLTAPVNLIVPDGNYHQAVKMTKSGSLKNIRRVKLPPGQEGEYSLRNSKDKQKVSTIEAIIKAIEIIENGPAAESMYKIFKKMIGGFKSIMG
jgi:DTW domain-containing protein